MRRDSFGWDCSQYAELQSYESFFENSFDGLLWPSFQALGAGPAKSRDLGGGLPPKNKTPPKLLRWVLDAEFNVDHDFFIKLDLP